MRTRIRSGVYQAINEVNGKSYVGSSINIDNRWSAHRSDAKDPNYPARSIFYAAIRKYGIENFTFIVLDECEPIKEALIEREQFYIDLLKPEYNILPTAGSRLGSKHSDETIEKLKVLNKENGLRYRQGRTFAEIFGDRVDEVTSKQSAGRTGKHVGFDPWNKGMPMDEEQRIKLSEIRKQRIAEGLITAWNKGIKTGNTPWNKGVPWSDEMKRKLSEAHIGQEAWNKGIPATDEQRQRASEIAKENYNPENQRRMTEAAREANTGKARSEETRRKISESNRTSEARKAFAESRRGIARTEEAKQNMSEALQNSEKAAAFHAGRVGQRRGNGSSGHAGISFDKNRQKWLVRFKGKSYGRYENLDDAVARSQEVLASL